MLTSPTTAQIHELDQARAEMLELFTASDMTADVAPSLSCKEAEIVARWIRAEAGDDAADTWLDEHAHGDTDPEDLHGDRPTAPNPPTFYDNLR